MMSLDKHQIAKDLMATACGEYYCGSALYDAIKIRALTDADRLVLSRWLDGSSAKKSGEDGFLLQDIAIRVKADAEIDANINAYYSDRNSSGLAALSRS